MWLISGFGCRLVVARAAGAIGVVAVEERPVLPGIGNVVAQTTLDIPDALFRKAKVRAAASGRTLKQLVTEALQERLAARTSPGSAAPAWMQGFGKLRRLRKETRNIQARVDEVFEVTEPEDRA